MMSILSLPLLGSSQSPSLGLSGEFSYSNLSLGSMTRYLHILFDIASIPEPVLTEITYY